MKRSLVILACLGMSALSAFAQSSRVRVVTTPTPAPPRIQNDPQISGGQRNAPVLVGGGQTRTQTGTPAPTPPATNEDEVIRVETNLVTMPVSVLDRDGRFI